MQVKRGRPGNYRADEGSGNRDKETVVHSTPCCVKQALQLWEPKSTGAAEKAILCFAADWVTPLTRTPNERKRASKPVSRRFTSFHVASHRFTSFRGNMSFKSGNRSKMVHTVFRLNVPQM